MKRAVWAKAAGSVPIPGPMTAASKRLMSSSAGPAHCPGRRSSATASAGRATSAARKPGELTTTMPAPDCWAAAHTRCPAPRIWGEPAMTRTARCHLWAAGSAAGNATSASASVTSHDIAPLASSPIGASSTSPAATAPGCSNRPGFSAPKVTVIAAGQQPWSSPVSASIPEGMSTASTGAAGAVSAPHDPCSPVPYAASMTRSHAADVGAPRLAVPTSSSASGGVTTRQRTPHRSSAVAATRPSAPLLPLPAATSTRRP